jgi:predicted RNA-binding protein
MLFYFEGGLSMCEAHAFILKDGKEEKILESVDLVEFEEGHVRLTSIFGEQKSLNARLKLYDNSKNKILFEPV